MSLRCQNLVGEELTEESALVKEQRRSPAGSCPGSSSSGSPCPIRPSQGRGLSVLEKTGSGGGLKRGAGEASASF